MITLADVEPIASGHLRLVYADPSDARLLIKVMRADIVEARWGANAPWYRKLKRTGPYAGYVKELKEYLAARAACATGDPPIVRVVGIAETDVGLGLVVERVADEHGALATTFGALIEREGYADWMRRALDEMFEGLLRHNVIVGDLHPWNIVYGHDSRGGPRFVLIDGFGERNVIPRCSMSRHVNRYNTRKHYRKLLAKIAEWQAVLAARDKG